MCLYLGLTLLTAVQCEWNQAMVANGSLHLTCFDSCSFFPLKLNDCCGNTISVTLTNKLLQHKLIFSQYVTYTIFGGGK